MSGPLRLWVVLGLATLAGCRCRPGPVDPVELGLRVAPSALDFGRVLEGGERQLPVTLTSTTRSPVSVELSTQSPFAVNPTSIEVPGGSDVTVQVRFRAGNGEAQNFLTLQVGDRSAVVPLRGLGVRPPVCTPSGECIVSTYSLEEDRCIEVQAADDAPCDPSSVCLEQGRCRAGACLGVARSCDDDDACTDDACAMEVGCIHTPHTCPGPTAACQVATCDSRTGCGFGPAPDLTKCGDIDCVEANFCFMGTCRREPTPEGYPCSPAIACLPEATCQQQQCRRVSEAEWTPDWSAPVQGQVTGELASSGATLYFSMCLDRPDAGLPDAGLLDAGDVDAGEVDAGEVDAGEVDAGELDAGLDDAGSPDSGLVDAGVDGGVLVCGLSSFTGSGFLRFTRPYEDELPRRVLAVNPEGVVVWRDGGLEVRSTVNGLARFQTLFGGGRSQVAIARTGIYFVENGALQEWVDGGLRALAVVEPSAQLAKGEALFTWDADAGLLRRFDVSDDGGVSTVSVSAGAGLPSSLGVSNATAVLGGAGRLTLFDDGGSLWIPFDFADAGFDRRFDEQTLSSGFLSDVLLERCDGGGCSIDLDGFDALTGARRWSGPLFLPQERGRLLQSTLVDLGAGDNVVAVVRLEGDGGVRTEARLLVQGETNAICRLPQLSGDVLRAHFSSGALVVVVRRPDGRLVLESYPLGVLPLARTGWPSSQGVGGTRVDR